MNSYWWQTLLERKLKNIDLLSEIIKLGAEFNPLYATRLALLNVKRQGDDHLLTHMAGKSQCQTLSYWLELCTYSYHHRVLSLWLVGHLCTLHILSLVLLLLYLVLQLVLLVLHICRIQRTGLKSISQSLDEYLVNTIRTQWINLNQRTRSILQILEDKRHNIILSID